MEKQTTFSPETALALAADRKFFELRNLLLTAEPVDIAPLFEQMTKEQSTVVFRFLPKELAAEVFVNMEPETQEFLISSFTDSELRSFS